MLYYLALVTVTYFPVGYLVMSCNVADRVKIHRTNLRLLTKAGYISFIYTLYISLIYQLYLYYKHMRVW